MGSRAAGHGDGSCRSSVLGSRQHGDACLAAGNLADHKNETAAAEERERGMDVWLLRGVDFDSLLQWRQDSGLKQLETDGAADGG